ncbi:MAG: DUF2220 family protein [Myxococcota bacterium]
MRRIEPDGRDRRWVIGAGGAIPGGADRLLVQALGREKAWARAGRAAGRGKDQVDAEALLWGLVDAGLVRVRERLTRRGTWQPYRWALTEAGERQVRRALAAAGAVDVVAYLAGEDPPGHALLERMRGWLEAHAASADATAVGLVIAIGKELRAGRVPRGRLLAIELGGHSKAVRVEDHREVLEAVLGGPLEWVVRLHGMAALAYGPFRFTVRGRAIDGGWSVPWLALTQETLAAMTDLELDARELLTVENLVAFEEEVRRGLEPGVVAVFVGGFPAGIVRDLLMRLCAAGIARVRHWGDLDLGGLRILRHLADILPVPVAPYRMQPELLDVLPTRPLTARDRAGLEAWLTDPAAPARDLAAAMLARGVKAEQEGWFVAGPGRRGVGEP